MRGARVHDRFRQESNNEHDRGMYKTTVANLCQAYMWFLTSRYLSTIVGKSLVVIERGTHVYADMPG